MEFDSQGQRLVLERSGEITNTAGKASFMLHLKIADFEGKKALQARLVLHWQPTEAANAAIKAENDQKLKEFKERSAKPLLCILHPAHVEADVAAFKPRFVERDLPVFPSFERAAAAFAKAVRHFALS